MTPTATPNKPTKSKSQGPLAELERLGRIHAEVQANASELEGRHATKLRRYRELTDERHRLVYREPGLVDHTGRPLDENNAVAQIDKQIAELGDVNDAWARVEHARRLVVVAKQSLEGFIAENYAAIIGAKRSHAEAVATTVNAKIREAADAVDLYMGFHGEVVGYIAATGGDTRDAPGLDSAAELTRVLHGFELPVPLPEVDL